ncbi:hypothetical protein KSP40_PGU006529 [Platanthera guangdongensis]|uniref:Uncharacterized protein n=1 Tax=Platanthera guangdongensis TaxID=2320717 RepID=A0ABR2M7X1_9ASPA
MAAVSWCKGALRAVLVLNTMLYATVLGLAASSINKILDNDVHHRLTGNISTVHFLIFSLISGVMGLCSIAAGLVHLGAWRGDSLAAAVSSALVAWSMTVVTFGFACKLMCFGNHWGANMRALEAFIVIVTVSQLLYLMMLHLGISSSRFGVGYRNYCNAMEYGRADEAV